MPQTVKFHSRHRKTSKLCGKIISRLDINRNKPITYKEKLVLTEKKLNLPSEIESVEKAASEAEKFARDSGLDDAHLFAIDMAVRESVANAVKHGNKFDTEKNVDITFSNTEKGFEVTVRDYGNGFMVEDVPDPTNPENLLKANGRGILFMNNFMDEVEWENPSDGGLVVKMRKKP